ncbi:MAG: ATP phosphoribosyltransferase regulatory subunit [Ruminococcus sp.]|nr:ATP phosphoribosyltransferase regulatory subunit [Ruminococcus sp.]
MNTSDLSLSFNEKVIFKLRKLYARHGYSQYKMNKFEEYDLYARNKDFLISDSVITFTDTNGKLMALKPDVTLSIIKNSKDTPDTLQKVYYDENVYRIAKGTNTFKEIMQVGLECVGDIDKYAISETLMLACLSLKTISDNSVLDISHLGIITAVFDAFDIPSFARKEMLKFISEKNIHELSSLCSEIELTDEKVEIIKSLIAISGKPEVVLPQLTDTLSGVIDTTVIEELKEIIDSFDDDLKDMINIDFSVISDTRYYNTIVFKGFIEGVPTSVLTGGQYDKLLQKMKRKSGAIGFAVYLDVLDRLAQTSNEYDVDIILLYTSESKINDIKNKVKELSKNGDTVFACKQIPSDIKYKTLIKINE